MDVGIDEAGKEDPAVAIDVDGAVGVSADAVTVDNDGSGREKTVTVKYAHIVNGSFVMGGHIVGWRSAKGSYARQIRCERHDAEQMTGSTLTRYVQQQLCSYIRE